MNKDNIPEFFKTVICMKRVNMDKENIPKFFQTVINMKRVRLDSYTSFIKLLNNEEKSTGSENNVILLTSLGKITGKIITSLEKDEDLSSSQQINIGALNAITSFTQALEKDIKDTGFIPHIIGNPSVVTIEDAILSDSSGHKQTFKILNIFADQIIGFSVDPEAPSENV